MNPTYLMETIVFECRDVQLTEVCSVLHFLRGCLPAVLEPRMALFHFKADWKLKNLFSGRKMARDPNEKPTQLRQR